MRELYFLEGKITGGWDVVKNYGSHWDFWEGIREWVLKRVKMVLGRVLVEEVNGWWGVIGMSGARGGGLEGFRSYERGLLLARPGTEYGWIEGIKVPRIRGIRRIKR